MDDGSKPPYAGLPDHGDDVTDAISADSAQRLLDLEIAVRMYLMTLVRLGPDIHAPDTFWEASLVLNHAVNVTRSTLP